MNSQKAGNNHQVYRNKEQQLEWLPEAQVVLVRNVDPQLNYLLITNSLHIEFAPSLTQQQTCSVCQSKHAQLEFRTKHTIQRHSCIMKEIADFKYCVLVVDRQGSMLRILGTTQKGKFYLGNLVAKKSTYNSQKKLRENGSRQTEEDNLQFQQLDFSSMEKLGSQMTKLQEVESCQIYITKLQKEIGHQYRSNFFHEYIWSDPEIQFLTKEMHRHFGDFQSFVEKRKYLKFKFKRSNYDEQFWTRWRKSQGDILFRRDKAIENNIINYYVISKQCLLNKLESSIKLFELPSNSPIVDLCIVEPWIIIAGQSYLLFLHNYRPMEYFKHIDKVKPTRVKQGVSPGSVVVLHKEGFLSCFRLFEKTVIEEKIMKVSFLVPYCLVEVEKGTFLAGIDIEWKGEQRVAVGTRKIYRIAAGITDKLDTKQVRVQTNSEFIVTELTKQKRNHPISNLQAVKPEVLACSCRQIFYLYNVYGQKLIEVQLKSGIKQMSFAPYPFNLFNFIIVTEQGQLIRIGIEAYGETLGSELQRLKTGDVKGFVLARHLGVRCSVIIQESKRMGTVDYLKGESEVLMEESESIASLGSDVSGVAYLIDKEHFYQLKYLEL